MKIPGANEPYLNSSLCFAMRWSISSMGTIFIVNAVVAKKPTKNNCAIQTLMHTNLVNFLDLTHDCKESLHVAAFEPSW